MPPIHALIFDMDGVIVNSAEWHYQSWQRLADEEGWPFDRRANEALRGRERAESLRLIVGDGLDKQREAEYLERKNRYFWEQAEHMSQGDILPGVLALLEQARARNLRLGVASASRNASAVLRRLGLYDIFGVVADGNMPLPPKPAPDLFLWVAHKLNVQPCQAIVFEDSQHNLEAALQAGFWTVGLGEACGSQAHLRYPDLSSVSLDDLLCALA
ncbi:MAG: beta-phosphoglucomutase family hydrolase [Anaerolineae bacterium]|nr:beta-phosphoglucomutase family hydrolase [Anaerolineae bacterium]MDW8172845.1 beta-phosphoglucomutase family hydrolase [Anaerolineae bacterium]